MFAFTKSAFASRTVIAGIVALVASILSIFGYTVHLDLQTEIVGVILSVITALSAVVAIYGRIVATKAIRR
ncbi:hypothetical protein [Paracoccus sp. (in: a-proteobacteria)]|uniref:hypothetical protein n=1 Tax=Paracoccus sp. TaxID=267 RepID=UPI0026DFC320|nr:hypothetical protein [Paracoccus sp. (in: a-proteobacteria)]MDO5647360.1 hypothetical protein [Paracoccus sp. (in: a-proteobacteria)]